MFNMHMMLSFPTHHLLQGSMQSNCYLGPGRRAKYCSQHVSKTVGLSVPSKIFPNHVQILWNFLYVLSVAWFFSDDSAISYVLPILWMSSCFHIMVPTDQNQARHYVLLRSPGGGNSRTSDSLVWSRSPDRGIAGEIWCLWFPCWSSSTKSNFHLFY